MLKEQSLHSKKKDCREKESKGRLNKVSEKGGMRDEWMNALIYISIDRSINYDVKKEIHKFL